MSVVLTRCEQYWFVNTALMGGHMKSWVHHLICLCVPLFVRLRFGFRALSHTSPQWLLWSLYVRGRERGGASGLCPSTLLLQMAETETESVAVAAAPRWGRVGLWLRSRHPLRHHHHHHHQHKQRQCARPTRSDDWPPWLSCPCSMYHVVVPAKFAGSKIMWDHFINSTSSRIILFVSALNETK